MLLHPLFPVLLEYAFVMGLPGIKIVLSGFGRRFDGAFRGQLIQKLTQQLTAQPGLAPFQKGVKHLVQKGIAQIEQLIPFIGMGRDIIPRCGRGRR